MTTIQDALITAVQSRNEGNFGFALTIAQRVVASDPAQFDAWCLLGDVSRRLGDLEQSAGAYRNAIALRLALHGREILPTDGTICDAAIMTQLDLVISPDTAIVHLAGGLGVPTWLVLPTVPHWPWMMDRDDSLGMPRCEFFGRRMPDSGTRYSIKC